MHCAPIGDVANEVSYVAVGAQCIYIPEISYIRQEARAQSITGEHSISNN